MVSLWADAASNVRVVRLTGHTEIAALMQLFAGVAAEEGWQPGDALSQWQTRSVYFALELDGQFVGGLQLVLPDPRGTLPCQSVWPEVALNGQANRRAHIAILALDAAHRGQAMLFWRLVIEMWRYCVGEGIANLYIEVTPRVLPIYHRLGWPLVIVGNQRMHWGEDCYLCTLGVAEVAAALLHRAEGSELYREIVMQAFRVTVPVVVRSVPKHQIICETGSVYAIK